MVASVDLAAPPAPLNRQTAPSARTAPDIPAALRMGRGSGSVMFAARPEVGRRRQGPPVGQQVEEIPPRPLPFRLIGGQQQGGSGDVQGLVDVPGGVGQPTACRVPSGQVVRLGGPAVDGLDLRRLGDRLRGPGVKNPVPIGFIRHPSLLPAAAPLWSCGRPSHSVCYRGRHPGGLPRRQPFALQVCGQGLEGGRIQRREGRTCSSGVFAYAYVLDRDRGIVLAYYHAAQDFCGREPWRVLVSPNVDGP